MDNKHLIRPGTSISIVPGGRGRGGQSTSSQNRIINVPRQVTEEDDPLFIKPDDPLLLLNPPSPPSFTLQTFQPPKPKTQTPPKLIPVSVPTPVPRPMSPPKARYIQRSASGELLDTVYLINKNFSQNSIRITLQPGRDEFFTQQTGSLILRALESLGHYKSGVQNAGICKKVSRQAFEDGCKGGKKLHWQNPQNKSQKTLFIIQEDSSLRYGQASQNKSPPSAALGKAPSNTSSNPSKPVPGRLPGLSDLAPSGPSRSNQNPNVISQVNKRKQTVGETTIQKTQDPTPKPKENKIVEVIDLDSDSDEDDSASTASSASSEHNFRPVKSVPVQMPIPKGSTAITKQQQVEKSAPKSTLLPSLTNTKPQQIPEHQKTDKDKPYVYRGRGRPRAVNVLQKPIVAASVQSSRPVMSPSVQLPSSKTKSYPKVNNDNEGPVVIKSALTISTPSITKPIVATPLPPAVASSSEKSAIEDVGVNPPVYSTVQRGLPSKNIVPCGKSVSSYYAVQSLTKLREKHKDAKLSFGIHPFLGDRFLVVNITKLPQSFAAKKAVPETKTAQKRKMGKEAEEIPAKRSALNAKNSVHEEETIATRALRTRRAAAEAALAKTSKIAGAILSSSKATAKSTTQTKLVIPPAVASTSSESRPRRVVRQISLSSDDSSSSGSSDSSDDSDSESDDSESEDVSKISKNKAPSVSNTGRPLRTAVTKNQFINQNARRPEVPTVKPFRYFSEMDGTKPLRRGGDHKIYFSRKAKLTPNQYYKNEDLFVNWEKYVRNESNVSSYYKTLMMPTALSHRLAIYHLEKRNDEFRVDRSVEMVSDGTIKVSLQGQDVTSIFMRYVDIETTNDLNALLSNLMNSSLCSGCVGFESVIIFPDAIFKDDVWYSKKCSHVVFNTPEEFFSATSGNNNFYRSITKCCPPCNQMRKPLITERNEVEALARERKWSFLPTKTNSKKKGAARARNEPVKYAKYTPPSSKEDMQIRISLSSLFQEFWNELGFNETILPPKEEIPKPPSAPKQSENVAQGQGQSEGQDGEEEVPFAEPIPEDEIPIVENVNIHENGIQTNANIDGIPVPTSSSGISSSSLVKQELPPVPVSTIAEEPPMLPYTDHDLSFELPSLNYQDEMSIPDFPADADMMFDSLMNCDGFLNFGNDQAQCHSGQSYHDNAMMEQPYPHHSHVGGGHSYQQEQQYLHSGHPGHSSGHGQGFFGYQNSEPPPISYDNNYGHHSGMSSTDGLIPISSQPPGDIFNAFHFADDVQSTSHFTQL